MQKEEEEKAHTFQPNTIKKKNLSTSSIDLNTGLNKSQSNKNVVQRLYDAGLKKKENQK